MSPSCGISKWWVPLLLIQGDVRLRENIKRNRLSNWTITNRDEQKMRKSGEEEREGE
jgi:hypothetical protein